jgi:hypothetical protein
MNLAKTHLNPNKFSQNFLVNSLVLNNLTRKKSG